MEDFLLGIDGGQTATRALIAREDGTILGRGQSGPVRHIFAGSSAVAQAALHDATEQALREAGIGPGDVAAAVCAITGIRLQSPEAGKVLAMMRQVVRPRQMQVVPDFVAGLAGASEGRGGVVVAAGGGSVAYGRMENGREAQAGGFGYLLGDEGSGYDIGRRAVSAAIRANDGRGAPTELERIVNEALGLSDLQEIKRLVYTPDFSPDRLAALAPRVAGAADAGDRAARQIMTDAGSELAQLGIAVIRRLYEPGAAVAVYPTGGVFAAGDAIERPFREALRVVWPAAEVRVPESPAVVGAVILARRPLSGWGSAG